LVVDFAEIESYARFYNRGKRLISLGETQFLIENVAIADSTFLEMFDFELLAGDRQTALDEPWTIILTEETALKFFKDPLAALGASVRFADKDYKVTGVAAKVPENSHLKFDAITSVASLIAGDKNLNNQW